MTEPKKKSNGRWPTPTRRRKLLADAAAAMRGLKEEYECAGVEPESLIFSYICDIRRKINTIRHGELIVALGEGE